MVHSHFPENRLPSALQVAQLSDALQGSGVYCGGVVSSQGNAPLTNRCARFSRVSPRAVGASFPQIHEKVPIFPQLEGVARFSVSRDAFEQVIAAIKEIGVKVPFLVLRSSTSLQVGEWIRTDA